MIACRIQVTGRVQGVFYRASTKDKATDLGLRGWVKNQPDGSVLIEVEGEEDMVSEFIEWCKHGPPLANVRSVDFESVPICGYKNFVVTH